MLDIIDQGLILGLGLLALARCCNVRIVTRFWDLIWIVSVLAMFIPGLRHLDTMPWLWSAPIAGYIVGVLLRIALDRFHAARLAANERVRAALRKGKSPVEDYTKAWNAQPRWWQIWNRSVDNLQNAALAIRGKMTIREAILLDMICELKTANGQRQDQGGE